MNYQHTLHQSQKTALAKFIFFSNPLGNYCMLSTRSCVRAHTHTLYIFKIVVHQFLCSLLAI